MDLLKIKLILLILSNLSLIKSQTNRFKSLSRLVNFCWLFAKKCWYINIMKYTVLNHYNSYRCTVWLPFRCDSSNLHKNGHKINQNFKSYAHLLLRYFLYECTVILPTACSRNDKCFASHRSVDKFLFERHTHHGTTKL